MSKLNDFETDVDRLRAARDFFRRRLGSGCDHEQVIREVFAPMMRDLEAERAESERLRGIIRDLLYAGAPTFKGARAPEWCRYCAANVEWIVGSTIYDYIPEGLSENLSDNCDVKKLIRHNDGCLWAAVEREFGAEG